METHVVGDDRVGSWRRRRSRLAGRRCWQVDGRLGPVQESARIRHLFAIPNSGEELYIKSRFWGKGNGRQVVAVSNSRVHHTDPDTLSEYVFYDENSPVIFQCLGDTLVLYVGIPAPQPPKLRTGFTIVQRHDKDLVERSAIDRAFDRRLRAVREGASCFK
ncbi:MAG: hypothetical protein IPP62_09705 [bacterium]|nr:hypothetical protein [bacterium]